MSTHICWLIRSDLYSSFAFLFIHFICLFLVLSFFLDRLGFGKNDRTGNEMKKKEPAKKKNENNLPKVEKTCERNYRFAVDPIHLMNIVM